MLPPLVLFAHMQIKPTVQTKISFNGGGSWQMIKAPSKFNYQKCDRCGGAKECSLHLHGMPYPWGLLDGVAGSSYAVETRDVVMGKSSRCSVRLLLCKPLRNLVCGSPCQPLSSCVCSRRFCLKLEVPRALATPHTCTTTLTALHIMLFCLVPHMLTPTTICRC